MSRYHFELAGTSDDPALRAVLAETPMPGIISIAFTREPSYFAASVVEGPFRQAIVVREMATNHILGIGSRSIRPRYVNAKPTPIGYLSTLRLVSTHRRRGLLARGYRFLRALHEDGRTQLYLTSIAEDNGEAIAAITSGRAGLPKYHPAGRYQTVAIPLSRRAMANRRKSNLEIRHATMSDVDTLLQFLHERGLSRQFFPCYEAGDLFNPAGSLRGLRPEDLLLALDAGRLVGTFAAWDQQSFRQNVIRDYSPALHYTRPLYNIYASLRGLPRLPKPDQPLRCLIGAMPLVAGDDPRILAALIDAMIEQRTGRDWDYLLVGMHESDPLLPALRRYPARSYNTILYLVCWEDGESLPRSLDGRPIHLELGSL